MFNTDVLNIKRTEKNIILIYLKTTIYLISNIYTYIIFAFKIIAQKIIRINKIPKPNLEDFLFLPSFFFFFHSPLYGSSQLEGPELDQNSQRLALFPEERSWFQVFQHILEGLPGPQ